MLGCLSKRSATAHAYSTQPAVGLQRAKVLPALPHAAELESCSHHLPAYLPKA